MTKNLDPPKVQTEAYGGQSVHSLGSCILHLHIDNKAFLTIFKVINMIGPTILGRSQAKAMGYVQFPRIKQPHTFTTHSITLKKICMSKTPTPQTATGAPHRFKLYPTQSTCTQKWVNQSNPSKAVQTDYRTSGATNKMEHRLHRAVWWKKSTGQYSTDQGQSQ